MGVVLHGRVEGGRVILSDPVALPDGTPVTVAIEVARAEEGEADSESPVDFAAEPYFGAWGDREEMRASAAWVDRQRDAWQQRLTPED
jgi:hypothetical protein